MWKFTSPSICSSRRPCLVCLITHLVLDALGFDDSASWLFIQQKTPCRVGNGRLRHFVHRVDNTTPTHHPPPSPP
ncbi:hypothetical protein F4678DRAFT_452399 [Xylaria arbuscula]|nr:hypothetical protein F4678DRAFT_452399 [Xylaria arbuscula]